MIYTKIITAFKNNRNSFDQSLSNRYHQRALLILPLISKGYLPLAELKHIHNVLLTDTKLDIKDKSKLIHIFFEMLKQLNAEQFEHLRSNIQELLSEEFLVKINDGSVYKIGREEKSWDIPTSLTLDFQKTFLFNELLCQLSKEDYFGQEYTKEEAYSLLNNIGQQDEVIKKKIIQELFNCLSMIKAETWSEIAGFYIQSEGFIIHLMQQVGVEFFLLAYADIANSTSRNCVMLCNVYFYLYDYFLKTALNISGVETVHHVLADKKSFLDDKNKSEVDDMYLYYCTLREKIESDCLQAVTICELSSNASKNIDSAIMLFILSKEHLPSFKTFYQQFNKINQRNDAQHQVDWIDFETRYLRHILMLVEIMGNDAFKFLTSSVAQTCLPLDRLLGNIEILPPSFIERLSQVYIKNKQPFSKNLESLIHLISCITCITQWGGEEVSEILGIFDAPENTNIDAVYKALINYLFHLVFNENEQTILNMTFDQLIRQIPLHLFIRLVRSKQTMSANPYETIYFEMIKRDISPEIGTVTALCHDKNQNFKLGRELASHNAYIRERLESQGIKHAINYTKTLDLIIHADNADLMNITQIYAVLLSYLEQSVSIAGNVLANNENQVKKLQALESTWLELKKIAGQKEFFALSREHAKSLFNKIKRQFDAIEKNIKSIDCQEQDKLSFKEFKTHFTEQLDLMNKLSKPAFSKIKRPLQEDHLKIRIQQWDKNDPRTFFLGDYVGCCLASDASQFSAAVQRRMDDGMQFFVATNMTTKEPIALFWMYLAEDNAGNIYLVMNFPEVAARYGENEDVRKAIIVSLLQFTDQYLQDNPGIKDFLMCKLNYGWNIHDLDFFPMQPTPEGFNKLGGPFVPGYSPKNKWEAQLSEEDLRKFTQKYYYLKSLGSDQFHFYSREYINLLSSRKVKCKEQIAHDIMAEVAMKILRNFAKTKKYDNYTLKQLKLTISKYGLVDVVWDEMAREVTARLSAIIREFFSSEEVFISFIVEQRGLCTLTESLSREKQTGETDLIQHLSRDMFFYHSKYADYLSERRHNSPKTQQEYDKQFGLILRK